MSSITCPQCGLTNFATDATCKGCGFVLAANRPLAIGYSDPTYLLLGFIGLIAAIIYGIVAVRIVAPAKIDDRFVWLSGVNKQFLSELPEWPGP